MTAKNILIAVDNGIIGLDIQKQLTGCGYNAEVINLVSKENIKRKLNKHFQLIILEKCMNEEGIDYAMRLAQEYKLPVISLSTGIYSKETEMNEQRILMMPFDEEDLKKNVEIALGEN
jgi:CheY-like chemotaxis protein